LGFTDISAIMADFISFCRWWQNAVIFLSHADNLRKKAQPTKSSQLSCSNSSQFFFCWNISVIFAETIWSLKHFGHLFHSCINSLASTRMRGFLEKNRLNAHGFAREFLWSGMLYWPSKSLKRRGKSPSLHSKKHFLLGGCGFLWVTS